MRFRTYTGLIAVRRLPQQISRDRGHLTRGVVHFNVTEHPTATWTAQQIVEAFPETVPRYLVRDRNGVYGP
jgi:hypothetical protein